jgi:hypothetical protein
MGSMNSTGHYHPVEEIGQKKTTVYYGPKEELEKREDSWISRKSNQQSTPKRYSIGFWKKMACIEQMMGTHGSKNSLIKTTTVSYPL